MKNSINKKIWQGIKIIIVFYVTIGIALYFLQDKFLFHPRKLPADYQYQFSVPFRETVIPVSAQKNLSYVQFTVPDSVFKGIVLYFHGNRENINRYAPFAGNFTRRGYEVWMMDYPGFGKSTGKRTEKGMYEDALTLYRIAIKKVAADSIIIYGKSLGTGVASQLASIRDCRRLILETPYYSMDALARHYFFMYPVIPMSKYSFPNHNYLEKTKVPVTIFHGTRDRVIPYSQAKRLIKKRPGIELVTIEKGRHNDLSSFPLFQEKLDSLLGSLFFGQ